MDRFAYAASPAVTVNPVHIEAATRRLAFGRMADGYQGKRNHVRRDAEQLAPSVGLHPFVSRRTQGSARPALK
jgi:hypothetical protein